MTFEGSDALFPTSSSLMCELREGGRALAERSTQFSCCSL
jgi:hypothetical protein